MIKVFQMAAELLFGFTVVTCVIPIEDKGKDMAVEPVRFACMVEVNDSGPYMVAGHLFKMEEEAAIELAGEWQ